MLFNLLLWLDIRLLVLITLGHCHTGETISAASWSLYLDGKWQGKVAVPIIDWLFSHWHLNHCQTAYQGQISLYQG